MNRKRKWKWFSLLLAAALMLGSTWPVYAEGELDDSAADAAESKKIVIYHTNDTHGYLAGSGTTLSIAQVAALKESTENSILVDAGDATQGLPLASLTKGADIIDLMNLAGYDVMAAGNHEFDFGADNLLSNAVKADFPILAANVYRGDRPLLSGTPEDSNGCHTIIERDNVKIGFFGLTTVDTATSTTPSGVEGLIFRNEVETAKQEIKELEEAGVDVIIGICHMGSTGVASTSAEALATALNHEEQYKGKLDVIIDGHSHTTEGDMVGDTLIVQAGSNMAAVGQLTLTLDDDNNVTEREEKLLYLPGEDYAGTFPENLEPDTEVAAKLEEITASQSELLNEEIGTLETTLWGGSVGVLSIARVVETNLGDLVADAFREAGMELLQTSGSEADRNLPVVAVENGGGIRGGLANGTVTLGDLVTAFPYSNTVYMKKVTPAILYQAFEVSACYFAGQDPVTGMLQQTNNGGGFLQVSGMTVEYNTSAGNGSRVVSITLEGQAAPLNRDDTVTNILMVSNNFIMTGGSDYTMLAELDKYGEVGGELETVQAYLEKCMAGGSIEKYAGTQGRILLRGNGYEPKNYSAAILIKDESGQSLSGKALSYRVDGGERINGVTNEAGELIITLSDGSHGIRLADSQEEIYVNNYTGNGVIVDQYRLCPTLTFLSDGSCDPVPEPSVSVTPTPEPTAVPTVTAAPTEQPSVTTAPAATSEPVSPDRVTATATGDPGTASMAVLLALGAGGAGLLTAAHNRRRNAG